MTVYFNQPSFFYGAFEDSSTAFYSGPDANCEEYGTTTASYVETRSGTLFVPSQQSPGDHPYHSMPNSSISPSSSRSASPSIDAPDTNCDNYEPHSSYVETRSGTLFVPAQQYSVYESLPSISYESPYEFVPNQPGFSQSSIPSCSTSPSSSRSASPSIGGPEANYDDYVAALPHEHYRHIDFDSMIQRNGGPEFLKRFHYQPTMEELLHSNVKPYYQNDGAILELNALRNRFLDCDILDLHYLQCNLAWKVLRMRAEEIVGKGKGSRDGVSKLKNIVVDFARNEGIRCVEMPGNEGVLILTFM